MKVEPLTRDQLLVASEILGRAFADYPSLVDFIPARERRHRLSPILHGMLARYAIAYGLAEIADGGVSLWLPPSHSYMTPLRMIRAGALTLPWRLGWRGCRKFAKLGAYLDETRRRLVPGPHWYLLLLGVDPARQQQGVGSALVQAGLKRADEVGLPCYLETLKEVNLRFYRKHGFQIMHETDWPSGEFRVWGLLRTAT